MPHLPLWYHTLNQKFYNFKCKKEIEICLTIDTNKKNKDKGVVGVKHVEGIKMNLAPISEVAQQNSPIARYPAAQNNAEIANNNSPSANENNSNVIINMTNIQGGNIYLH